MKAFYDSEARRTALRFHAGELLDTPFVAHAMVPGHGIDCVHVNAWCYLKTGLLADFRPPRYALDSGSHAAESQLLKWLDSDPHFHRGASALQCGDTICFSLGLSEHHVGLMLDENKFVHVLPRHRVIISDLAREQYYRRKVSAIYRPVEVNDVR